MSKKLIAQRRQLEALYLEYKKNSSTENRTALLKFWNEISQSVEKTLSADSSPYGNIKTLTGQILRDIQQDNPDMQAVHYTKSHVVGRNNEFISTKQKKLNHWSTVAEHAGKELGIIGSLAKILIKVAVHIENGKIADAQRASDMLNNLPEPLVLQEKEKRAAIKFDRHEQKVEIGFEKA